MNFKNLKEETKELIKALTISGVLIVLFGVMINHLPGIGAFLLFILNAVLPFLIGLLFTFILDPVRDLVEQKVLSKQDWTPKTKRVIAVVVSLVVFLLVLVSFFAILIPQLTESATAFVNSFDGYVKSFTSLVGGTFSNIDADFILTLEGLLATAGKELLSWLTGAQGGIAQILNASISVVRGVLNIFIGLIIAVYIQLDEERFKRQVKALLYAVFSERVAGDIVHVIHLTVDTFDGFVFGKFVDSLIIGIICYICCAVMKMPYSPLIAFVVGITNMIPVFGPFIGAIPCIFILLIIDPLKAVEFMIFILILQQIDGNIIGPRILGDAVGLPTLWVMFAIIVGGAMFGVSGMFVGVPIFSVIYTLTKERVKNVLKEKDIDVSKV